LKIKELSLPCAYPALKLQFFFQPFFKFHPKQIFIFMFYFHSFLITYVSIPSYKFFRKFLSCNFLHVFCITVQLEVAIWKHTPQLLPWIFKKMTKTRCFKKNYDLCCWNVMLWIGFNRQYFIEKCCENLWIIHFYERCLVNKSLNWLCMT
jgi:hypothetical protein